MIIDPYTWHRLRIDTLTAVSSDTITVGTKRPVDYQFRPGQYAVVRITKKDGSRLIRQYSFSSTPGDPNLELLIQRENEGEVSSWFHDDARPGDEIEVSQPLGSFTLPQDPKQPLLFIAGRIGITPFISMLRDKKRYSISIIYSVRSKDQICFEELLGSYDTTIIQTDLLPRLSKDVLREHVQTKPIVYICGSKQFVDSITNALHELGVSADDIKRELFTLQ